MIEESGAESEMDPYGPFRSEATTPHAEFTRPEVTPDQLLEAPRPTPLKARLINPAGDPESKESLEATFQKRLAEGAPLTKLLTFILLGVFLSSFLSSADFSSSDYWWKVLADRAFSYNDIVEMGGILPTSAVVWSETPRLLLSLFIHPGPWSLIFLVTTFFAIGRYVEQRAGSGQMIILFLFSGMAGNLISLLVASATETPSVFPSGAWCAIFGLIGAQHNLARRALLSKLQAPIPRGFIGSFIMVWIIASFHFQAYAFDIRTIGAVFGTMFCSSLFGYLFMRMLPAWIDDPSADIGCLSLFFCFSAFFISTTAFLTFALFSEADLSPQPNFNGAFNPSPNTNTKTKLRTFQNKDHSFSLDLPKGWSKIRNGDSFVTYGRSVAFGAYRQESIYLYIRERHAFDAPDTLVGRFLNMAIKDWNLSQSDIVILEEGAMEHSLGQAYLATYQVKKGSRQMSSGIHRCAYVLTKDQVYFFLLHGQLGENDSELCQTIVQSLKLLDNDQLKNGDGK